MNNDIGISFAGLVKNNNGLFKSEKQADFLLSKCEDNEYVASASIYGNTYDNTYVCDKKGVVKVIHYTHNKGETLVWERTEDGKITVQEEKEQKRIKREIKRLEKQISERQLCKDNGGFADCEWLFIQSMENDQEMLLSFKKLIK